MGDPSIAAFVDFEGADSHELRQKTQLVWPLKRNLCSECVFVLIRTG